ncbi:LysR family transcriptional regulator [Paraburkholderia sacchari]|uniref:LysR family transcriptional regulator n=1 Tax=Paraburkholderia sacchari TaxID=159450 RepID=UPI0039A6D355
MDKWAQIEFFLQVAESGSLSKAAERLGMSSAAASRCLNALEERLSARLIERTTRRLWLTDAGHEYQRRCAAIMAELAEADAAVSEATVNPTGTLRVTASVSFASIYIAPALCEFHQRYPNVDVQIVAANRYPNFIEAGIDVAIRTRECEADSGITVRKFAETRRVLAATPGYLARRGTPMTPDALAGHDMLVYNLANDPYVLHFSRGAKKQSVAIKSVLDANEGQVIRAAALADLGILIQPLYIIHADIVAGKLVPVLTDWRLPALTINIAYQSRRHLPAKIRVFTEFLIERFERLGLARRWNEIAP